MTSIQHPIPSTAAALPVELPTDRHCWQEAVKLLVEKGYRIEFGQAIDGELAGLFWFTWENPSEPSWDIEAAGLLRARAKRGLTR
jgi:hypothetical protein